MSARPTTRTRRAADAAPSRPVHCPENDCQRQQAEALTRMAEVGEHFMTEFAEMKPHLEAIGEVVGKWLKFCTFVRKWFPRVGWWLLPIGITLITKGSSEGVDALIQALTVVLQNQAGVGS